MSVRVPYFFFRWHEMDFSTCRVSNCKWMIWFDAVLVTVDDSMLCELLASLNRVASFRTTLFFSLCVFMPSLQTQLRNTHWFLGVTLLRHVQFSSEWSMRIILIFQHSKCLSIKYSRSIAVTVVLQLLSTDVLPCMTLHGAAQSGKNT